MIEAEKRIREALADEALHDEGASVSDTLYAAHVFEEACTPENIAALLAEIDRLRAAVQHEADCVEAAKAEIDRLTRERDALAKQAGPFRQLVDACKLLSSEAEEYEFDDGMGRGAMLDYWHEFDRKLDAALAQIEQEKANGSR